MPPIGPNQDTSGSRRDFFQATVGLSAAALAAQASVAGAAEPAFSPRLIEAGSKLLFQGDSITDAGRNRKAVEVANRQSALGQGYVWLAAASLLVDRPADQIAIYNRGISGDKVYQLAARWQADCVDLQPEVLTILVGVNDFWHGRQGQYDGTVETYEQDYAALLERTREALPQVKLVLGEPFVLRCGAVSEDWFPEFDNYRAAARRVADATGATFVPFQSVFDEAAKYAPPEHWAEDGVHPTTFGAALLAHAWLRAVGAAG